MQLLKTVLLTFLIISSSFCAQAQSNDEIFTMVDQMPVFPGCDSSSNATTVQECTTSSLSYFLQQNLIIPFEFQKSGFKDIVFASFVVNEEGHITQPTILRGSKNKNARIDSAAITSIKFLPRMLPGKNVGKVVKVKINVAIPFMYKEKEIIESDSQLFTIVEEMPAFQGCEDAGSKLEKQDCTGNRIYEFITKRAGKTKLKREEEEETIMISYVVNEKGDVERVNVIDTPPIQPRLDSIAIEIVNSLPRFSPGTQRGKPVNVLYNVPIRFKKR